MSRSYNIEQLWNKYEWDLTRVFVENKMENMAKKQSELGEQAPLESIKRFHIC